MRASIVTTIAFVLVILLWLLYPQNDLLTFASGVGRVWPMYTMCILNVIGGLGVHMFQFIVCRGSNCTHVCAYTFVGV